VHCRIDDAWRTPAAAEITIACKRAVNSRSYKAEWLNDVITDAKSSGAGSLERVVRTE